MTDTGTEFGRDRCPSSRDAELIEIDKRRFESTVDLVVSTNQDRRRRAPVQSGSAFVSPHPRRLHQFFEAACDAAPEAVALECGPDRLSYRKLDERANRLAHHLLRSGLGRGAKVGILLHRSVETYVALLGVLKAGGAFVPIDVTWPAERAAFVAADAGLSALLTSAACHETTSGVSCPVLDVAALSAVTAPVPASRPGLTDGGDALCYVIYTSGSTGRPKGVEIAQSSICNFISVVRGLYGVRRTDRIYQGMTIAFDFSIEEIWPTWAVGATLVAGPTDDRRLGQGLAEFLADTVVSVFYCVPTLLATLEDDVPSIRTLVVGGEACSAELVERWSRPGRRILNTYGPTEATVTATCGELVAGRPVTIGRPLPTYRVYLLDDLLRRVPDGTVGEICIGGPGVARGYVGRPELTATRFPTDPFAGDGARLYRTGDLGRVLPNGQIEYLGRADSEVKVRGHRVDLQEIERVLLEDEAVGNAVAALLPAAGTAGELTAYVTRRAPDGDDHALIGRLRERLRRRLPPYMVPAFLEVLPRLPTLASGKVDRGNLPSPSGGRLRATDRPRVPARTPIEAELAAVWAEVFAVGADDISVEDDFFLDLGGHSLLAAGVVSTLRRRELGRSLAISDLYAQPTIAGLARQLEAASAQQAESIQEVTAEAARQPARPPRSGRRTGLCGLAQIGSLYVFLLAFGVPAAVVLHLNQGRLSVFSFAMLAAVALPTFVAGIAVVPVVASRLLGGGLRPGRYRLWGATYLRLWVVQRLLAAAPLGVLSGSPLLPPYLRLLGARVGRGCHIATAAVGLPALTEIGDGASVGYGAELHNSVVEGGWLTVKPVVVGAGAFVGANAVLLPGVRVGVGARLAEQSLAAQDQIIPNGEYWAGSPSKPCHDPDPLLEAMGGRPVRADWPPRLLFGFGVGLLMLMVLQVAMATPALILLFWAALARSAAAGALAVALAGPVFVVTTCLLIAGAKRVALRSAPPGIHPLRSALGVRKWFVDKLIATSLAATNSLYATLYTIPWLRALGARVGSWAEVSTVAHLDPDLLTLGDGSFAADLANVGSATFYKGCLALGRTEVGRRAFVGNAALVRTGTQLGDGSLIGVHTTPPVGGVPAATSWLGSPAIFLPRRQESQAFGEDLTYRPRPLRVIERLTIEFFRATLPGTLAVAIFLPALLTVAAVARRFSLGVLIVVIPIVAMLTALCAVLIVVVLKWVIVGRYRPRVEPLWGRFVRRTELVTGLYETVAVPALLGSLTGTPLLGPMLRLFGAHVGRRTWLGTTYLTEFDLVRVGDDAAVGPHSSLQTHLFEDRVMKMSTVTIGSEATVGARSVVLYDAEVGVGTALDALSLVMKGERLPVGTRWRGIPCRAIP